MNSRYMAHEILDRVRAGGYASPQTLTRALRVTGDIPEMTAAESAHCLCPIAEAYAGMDDTADWAQTHWGVVGGAA